MDRNIFPGLNNKTPSALTLGVLLSGLQLLGAANISYAQCAMDGVGELAVVERVYDGDTIKLVDGRHVRILGVNTPEVDHGKERTGQPLGDEARRATEAFFAHEKKVRLFYDVQRVDRYERTLAHVYSLKNESLAVYLLERGLGFHVAIPPNIALNDCLHDREKIARKKQIGVWHEPEWQPRPASGLAPSDTGFKRVTGKVVNIIQAQSLWIELDGPLVIKISPADKKNFQIHQWQQLLGRQIEVRGWITARSKIANTENQPAGFKRSSDRSSKSLLIQPRVQEALDVVD